MTTRQTDRRTFLKTGATAAGLGALWGPFAATNSLADETPGHKKTKILLIGHQPDHPPGTHLYLPECELLAKNLRQSPGVEAVVSDRWPKDASIAENVDSIVVYSSPGAELLLKGPHGDQVEEMLADGVGLVAIHWATGVRDKDDLALSDRYLNHLGGLFSFAFCGLAFEKTRVERLAPEHAVSRGFADFESHDEYYLNLKFLPDTKPVLKVHVKDKDQTVAWTYERPGGGRSYGNTLGHFHTNFGIDSFRASLINGILWTARHEIPVDGAPHAVSEEDMVLS